MSWERWESSELRRWERCEKCVSGVGCQCGKDVLADSGDKGRKVGV